MARAVIANILGAKGPKGDKGDVGNTGPQGGQGVAGPVGPQGVPGTTGQAIDTIAAIAVKRTNLATNPSFENASGLVTVRTNLCPNPSVRVDSANWGVAVGWSSGVTVAVNASGGPVDGPSSFIRATIQTAGTGGAGYYQFTNANAIVAGNKYTVSRWVRYSSDCQVAPSIEWRDSADALLAQTSGALVSVPANTWVRLSFTDTAPTGATALSLDTYAASKSWNANEWFDGTGTLIEQMPILGTFFDGSTAASGDYTYSWASTANNSVSYQKGVALTGTIAGGILATAYQSSAWSNSRGKSMRITPAGASDPNSYAFIGGDDGAMRLGMVAGRTYTVSATCRLAAAQTGTLSGWARSIAFFYKLNGTYSTVLSSAAPNAAGTARVSVTVTIPAGATEAFIRLMNGALQGGGDVWWDDILIEESAILSPYFDGNTPGAYWTGSVDASTSVIAALGSGVKDSGKVLRGDGTWGSALIPSNVGTLDLNTVVIPGIYKQPDGNQVTLGRNYPVNGPAGTLMVMEMNGADYLIQEYSPMTGGENAARVFYRREYVTPNWSPWRRYSSSRVDQSVGRRIFQWNEVANQDQMIYGDTGEQIIKDLALNGWTLGLAYLRRLDNVVHLGLHYANPDAATSDVVLHIPEGFRPAYASRSFLVPIDTGSGVTSMYMTYTGDISLPRSVGAISGGAICGVSWTTNDSWPLLLPGSAMGLIPNG